jgi:integrase
MKLREDSVPAQLTLGSRLVDLLSRLPKSGKLFPNFCQMSSGHRSTEFTRRCRSVGIEGISLHSYRHAWAQRAKTAGYPQRFAQAALGHSSRAVHEAYARDAIVVCPPLEAYENRKPENLIAIPMTPAIAEQMAQIAS